MKRYIYIIICAALLVSCKDEIDLTGRQGVYEYSPNNFSGIGVQDGFELYLSNGKTPTVRIESDEEAIMHVKSEIKNGILYFYRNPEVEFPNKVSVKIYVTKDSLEAIMVSSSKIQIMDTLRTGGLELVLSGKSSMTGRIECKRIQSMISGSTVEITGISDTVQININGGSLVKMFGLKSNNVKVNISGGSFSEMTVYRELDVEAREKSILYYNYRDATIIRNLVLDEGSEVIRNLVLNEPEIEEDDSETEEDDPEIEEDDSETEEGDSGTEEGDSEVEEGDSGTEEGDSETGEDE
ncbi:MAG: DUF2807 domain-containing protein [Prevotellaceae bacterium]|jgi:hypothetical protein|nr:DUF2807 domain-containing protein [Prevotellaceae bacterium]